MSTTRTAGGTQQIEPKEGPTGTDSEAFPRVRTAEEVFVSPRVVDRVAFEDYAQALRKLLAAATSEGEHLRRTAVEASKSLRAIGEVLPAVDKKLSRAGDLVAQLSDKLERVEAAAKRAENAAERATTAEQRIRDMDERARHRIFEASGAAADEAVTKIETIAQKRADELDDRGTTLNEFVDRGRADLAETRSKATEALEKSAHQLKTEAAGAVEAIKAHRSQAQDAIAEDHQSATHAIDAARGEVVEAIMSERTAAEQALADRVSRLTARVDELVDASEERLAQLIEDKSREANERADAVAERIDGALSPKLEESTAAAEAAFARAEEAEAKARGVFQLGLEEIEKLCDRAEEVLGATGAGQDKPAEGTLAAITASAARAMEEMSLTAADGERARRQAEEARKALGESIESAALWLDRLVEQRDGLQQSISLATKLCEQAEGQLAKRRSELDEAMRAPATEVQRHVEALKVAAEDAATKRAELTEAIAGVQQQVEAKAGAVAEKAAGTVKLEVESLEAKVDHAREALALVIEQTEAKRAELAELIEHAETQAEKRAESKANAAADRAAEKAIHRAKIEAEKLDAKAVQARQALDQAWKTLETRLKGELKESLTALSAEGQRAERARQALREDIEAAHKVEKETRAAISKPAAPSSVEQLNRLATLMQDLAQKTAPKTQSRPPAKKPAGSAQAVPVADTPSQGPPASMTTKKVAKKTAKKATKSTTKKVAKKATTKKKPGG